MKHPEEGALGGPVLAGNPVADPMMAGVSRSSGAAWRRQELHQRRSEQSRAIRPNLNRIGTLTNSSGLPHFSF